jgi:hypothetical protein
MSFAGFTIAGSGGRARGRNVTVAAAISCRIEADPVL